MTAAANAQIKRSRDTCNSTAREICREEEKPVVEARDRAVEEIERKRQAAKIDPKA